MKIKKRLFKDVSYGEYFFIDDNLFLKVEPVIDKEIKYEEANEWNCVNLTINEMDWCPLGAEVVIINEPEIIL